MNLKRFRNQLLLLSVALLASCSSDADERWEYQPENKITTRAVSDIFNVQYLAGSGYSFTWWDGYAGIDGKANFYYTSEEQMDYASVPLMKINSDFDSIRFFASDYYSPKNLVWRFCFDENDNLCYLINLETLIRIKPNGSSWFEQHLSLPPDFSMHSVLEMCGSPDGFIYFLAEAGLCRISPRGVVTVIDVDLSSVDFSSDTELHKADSNNFYITTVGRSVCHRVNIDTKTVEEIQLGFNLGLRSSTCAGESLYSLDGQYVVKITPGQPPVDLGTIPTTIRNRAGKFVRLNVGELYVNKDATLFYTMGYFPELEYDEDAYCICKLTL